MNKKTGSRVPGSRLADLLLDPGERRVGADIDMDGPPGVDLHDDKDLCETEEGGVLGQEVAGPQFLGVVADEDPPDLVTARWFAARNHVAANSARGMLDSKLGGKLLSNLVLAPLGMVARDTLDEGDVLAGDVRSADLAGA